MSKQMTLLVALAVGVVGFGIGQMTNRDAGYPWEKPRGHAPSDLDTVDVSAMPPMEVRRLLGAILDEKSSVESVHRLATILGQLGPEGTEHVIPLIRDPGRDLWGAHTLLLAQFWADHDPAGLIDFSRDAPMLYRVPLLQIAVERLAEVDLARARPILGTGAGDNSTIRSLVRGWYRSGEPGLEDWVQGLGQTFTRQKALSTLGRMIAQDKGAAAAAEWVESLPDSDPVYKKEAFRKFAKEISFVEPSEGIAFYERNVGSPYDDDSLAFLVSGAAASVDPEGTMEWLETLPPGDNRDYAVQAAAATWDYMDSAGLVRWTEAQGLHENAQEWYDPALMIAAKTLSREDPARAIHWAEKLHQKSRRKTALVQVVHNWHREDPEAAIAWIGDSELTEEERTRATSTWKELRDRQAGASETPPPAANGAPEAS